MAPSPQYYLEEPNTGLLIALSATGSRVARKRDASCFTTANAARLAAAEHIADQAHELVRVDR